MNHRLLLLTKRLEPTPIGGREMLCKLNFDALSAITEKQLIVFELSQKGVIKSQGILMPFRGYIDGLSPHTIEQAIQLIIDKKIRKVFVDGSNLGGFVAILKRNLPEVEVITFFHNVEARFFWGALRTTKTLRAFVVFIVNYLAERKSVYLSDKRICLSERDNHILKSIYGRGATHISPMALKDKFIGQPFKIKGDNKSTFILFVGGNFYANLEGILWFVKYVAHRIDIKVCIVGKGMDRIREKLEIPGKVEVIGQVDDLSEWYRRALFVIAPIFDGSGMKTKVAEAMMYGKRVVGTREAFSGYEMVAGSGWICRTADDFVDAIATAQQEISTPFDQDMRKLFLKNYSFEAAKVRLKKIVL